MTITLELKPEIESRLIAQAAAQGMPVEEFLKKMIENLIVPLDESALPTLPPQERAKRFVNWARNHSMRVPPLSDQAISRESIYTREDEML